MALDLGSLLFRLGAETSGLRRAQGEMGSFRAGVTQTSATVARFLNKAEMREVNQGVKRLVGLRSEFNRLAGQVDPSIAAMNRYKRIQEAATRAVAAGAVTQQNANRILGLARNRWGLASAKVGGFTLAMQDLTKSVQIALGPLSGVAARITAFTGLLNLATAQVAIYVGGLIGLTAGLIKSVKAAKLFEDALIGVGKTTDLSGSSLKKFGDDATQLAIKLKAPITEVLNVAEAAGQLGISGSENLLKFTETVVKLGTATNLIGEEGAKQLARLINVTTTSISDIDKLGAVIVALGNNSAATEKEINKIALEVGQATSQFKISAFSAEAFGAALASIGARAELSGSVIGRAFRAIDKSIRTGGRALQNLSILTGIAVDDLKQAFEEDAAAVFRKFIEGLGRLDTQTMSVTQALELFGLKGEEINKILPSLVVNSNLLTEAFKIQEQQVKNSTALEEEFAKRSVSLTKELDKLKTLITAIAQTIGSDFLPNVTEAVRSINEMLFNTRELADNLELLAAAFLGALGMKVTISVAGLLARRFTAAGVAAAFASRSVLGLVGALLRFAGPIGVGITAGIVLFDLWKNARGAAEATGDYAEAIRLANNALKDQVDIGEKLRAQEEINKARVSIGIKLRDLQKELVEKQNELARGLERFKGAKFVPEKIFPAKQLSLDIANLERQIADLEGKLANLGQVTKDLRKEKLGVEMLDPFIGDPIKLLPEEESEKARRARERNQALEETIQLLIREAEAIRQGEAALAAFNREKSVEQQITQLVSKVRREEDESIEDFTKRREDFEKRVKDAVISRAEAELDAARIKSVDDIEDEIAALGREVEALGMGDRAWKRFKTARRVEVQIEAFEDTLEALGVERDIIDDLIERYQRLSLAKQRALEKVKDLKKANKELQKFVNSLKSSFQSAFEDAIVGGESLRKILKGLVDDLIRVAIRVLIVQRLIDALAKALGGGGFSFSGGTGAASGTLGGGAGAGPGFGPAGFAKGGILHKAQKGTIISKPTMVAPGVVGGEAGTEGVLPLGKTSSGELGVKAVGKLSGMSVNFSVVINDNSGNNNQFSVAQKKDESGGMRAVINIIAKDISEGGNVAKSLERNFGLRKTVALGRMI